MKGDKVMSARDIVKKDPADFTPTLGNYTDLQPFRFWCQKVLPLVYDDSLSYYELLCKVVDYLNKTMEDVGVLVGDVTKLHEAYKKLQKYVNDYFSALDVQEEINKKLDELVKSGKLDTLLNTFIPYGTPEMYGAKGDGVTDDTSAINKCILNHNKIILKGTYLISGDNTLSLGDYGTTKYCIDGTNKHFIGGTLLTNSLACFIKGDNTLIENVTFVHNNVGGKYLTSSCVGSKAKNICIKNCKSNVPVLQVFSSNNCRVIECKFNRTNDTLCGSIIAFYKSNYCEAINNTVKGGCGDGDIGCYGVSYNCKFIGNTLNAYNDKYSTKGLQGIYADSYTHDIIIDGNILENYYYGIDVKTNSFNVIVTNNVCKCKIGIAFRKGEGRGNVYNCVCSNNTINVGSKSDLTILQNADGKSITCYGIMLENCENVVIDTNSFLMIDKAITCYVYVTNSVGNNYINNCVFESYNTLNNIYISGISLLCEGDKQLTVNNCCFSESNDNVSIKSTIKRIDLNGCYFTGSVSGNEIKGLSRLCKCYIEVNSVLTFKFSGTSVRIFYCDINSFTNDSLLFTVNSDYSFSFNNVIYSAQTSANTGCTIKQNDIVYHE